MRRVSLLLSAVLLAGVLAPSNVQAQDSGFGLGFIFGSPSGISGKGWLSDRMALDGAVGWGLFQEGKLKIYVDFLWQFEIKRLEKVNIDWYVGVGPQIGIYPDNHHDDHPDNHHDSFWFGARAPVGIDFEFTPKVPLDVFVEVAVGLWLFADVDYDLDAAFGIRYWF